MTDELKPCPFCGGKAYTHQKDPYPYSYVQWSVGCMPCGVVMSRHVMKDKATATEQWNTRSSMDADGKDIN